MAPHQDGEGPYGTDYEVLDRAPLKESPHIQGPSDLEGQARQKHGDYLCFLCSEALSSLADQA